MISSEKKTAKPNNSLFYCALIIFILMAAAFLYADRPVLASRAYNPARACFSNLKTIEGAVELYIMENSSDINSLDDLVKNGYLKVKPVCYSRHDTKDSYSFSMPINKSNLSQFFKIVKCTNHGLYLTDKKLFEKEVDTAIEYRRERRNFFLTISAVLSILILWQLIKLWRKSSC